MLRNYKVRLLDDHDAVEVVGHHNKGIDGHIRKMLRDFSPSVLNQVSYRGRHEEHPSVISAGKK